MKKGYKECPFCANEIKEKAIKCQYCGEFLNIYTEKGKNDEKVKISNIKKDFIQKFFEKNNIARISKLSEYLFCNKNRISRKQAFAGWLKLRFLCGISFLPRKIIFICLGNLNVDVG